MASDEFGGIEVDEPSKDEFGGIAVEEAPAPVPAPPRVRPPSGLDRALRFMRPPPGTLFIGQNITPQQITGVERAIAAPVQKGIEAGSEVAHEALAPFASEVLRRTGIDPSSTPERVINLPRSTGRDIGAGLLNLGAGTAESLAQPENLVLLLGTAGEGNLARAASLTFATEQVSQLPEQVQNALRVVADPNATRAEKTVALGQPAVSALLARTMVRHGLTRPLERAEQLAKTIDVRQPRIVPPSGAPVGQLGRRMVVPPPGMATLEQAQAFTEAGRPIRRSLEEVRVPPEAPEGQPTYPPSGLGRPTTEPRPAPQAAPAAPPEPVTEPPPTPTPTKPEIAKMGPAEAGANDMLGNPLGTQYYASPQDWTEWQKIQADKAAARQAGHPAAMALAFAKNETLKNKYGGSVPLPPKGTAEPMVTLYHGEGGPEGGGVDTRFFTKDPKRAASYGPNVTSVEVPKSVADAAEAERQKQGTGTSGDVILPQEWVKQAKPMAQPPAQPVVEIGEQPAALPKMSPRNAGVALRKLSRDDINELLPNAPEDWALNEDGTRIVGYAASRGRGPRTGGGHGATTDFINWVLSDEATKNIDPKESADFIAALERVRNSIKGERPIATVPTKPAKLTAAAYMPEGATTPETGPHHPGILKRLGIKGFDTPESRNTPQFGFADESGNFLTREQAAERAKATGQDLKEFEPNEPAHSNEIESPTKPGVPISETQEVTPSLFVKQGRRMRQVTPKEASRLMDEIRSKTGLGASKLGQMVLYDINGKEIGHVSYNGNVWLGKELLHNATGLIKTPEGRWDIPTPKNWKEITSVQDRLMKLREKYKSFDDTLLAIKDSEFARLIQERNRLLGIGLTEPAQVDISATATPIEAKPGLIAGTDVEKWADFVIKKSGERLRAGLDPELAAAGVIKGAAFIERGITEFAKWSAAMIREFGEAIRPHLASLFEQAKQARAEAFRQSSAESATRAVPPPTTEGSQPPPSPPASPVQPGAAAAPSEPVHGIAARISEAAAAQGVIAPIEPGEGIAAAESVEHGRNLLSKGADPQAVLDEFNRTNAVTADGMAVVRAQGERLRRAAYAAADRFGTKSKEYEAAWKADSDWTKAIKPMQTEWHKIGQAQQGEVEIDTGTFHGLRSAFFEATGKDFTPEQKTAAEKIAKGVKQATDEADQAKDNAFKKIGSEVPATPVAPKPRRTAKGQAPVAQPTPQAVWRRARQIIDAGETDFDDVRHKLAIEFGRPVEEITRMLAEPKSIRVVTDEMYRKMSERRRLVQNAKNWLKDQQVPGWYRFIRNVPRVFFIDKVFGHGTVGMITHAGLNIFNPTAWSTYWPNFVRQYKLLVSPAYHERMMQDLVRDPLFTRARRAGLANDPFRYQDDYQTPGMTAWLGRLGLAGNRGFDSLKLFRQARFNQLWNDLPPNLKTPRYAQLLADAVNHSTGVVKARFGGEWANWTFFAPKLEGSRWAWMIGDPLKAANTFVGWADATPEARAFALAQLKEKAAIAGTYFGLLALNQGILSASGSKDQINYTNPRRSDFLSFKAEGHNIGIISPMLGMVRLFANMLHASMGQRGRVEKLQSRADEMGATVAQYTRGKLSPFMGFGVDLATQSDFQGRPLPFSSDTVPKYLRDQKIGKYTYGEYIAQEFTPIPVSEAVREVWRSQGMNESEMKRYMDALLVGVVAGGTGARITVETPTQKRK